MATFPTNVGGGGVSLPVSIADGGTGATTAPAALVALGATPTLGAVYGGGADGAFDLDGTNTYAGFFTKAGAQYTQLVDVRATTFVVRAAATLLPAQFWIYAETSFTNESNNVRLNGNNATGGTQGAAIAAAGTLQTATFAGAVGRSTVGVGTNGGSGSNHVGGAGGAAGAGGGNGGGFGGSVGTIAATSQGLGTPFYRQTHRFLAVSSPSVVSGGCGGGAGGYTLNGGTGTSGAGGGGASAIRVNARSFNNSGTISCNGGNAGNGVITLLDPACGGGGGGGGGFIGIMTDSYTNTGTISCLGGLGGTGAGTGAGNGVAGSAGRVSIMTPTGTVNS